MTMLYGRDPPEDNDDEQAGCKLMDAFAIFIQLCLAAAAFSTLIFKRHKENPRRPVRIWGFDVSKQLVGGIVIHSLNVVASYISGGNPEGSNSNPCVWYFLNIFVDTTIGVGILWGIHAAFQYILIRKLNLSGLQTGVYGDPPLQKQTKRWVKQLAVYIASLILMKLCVILLFHIFPQISDFGHWVLQWTMGDYKLQVVFVMLIFPLIMNIIQFWIIDTIVKHKTPIRLSQDEDEDVLVTDDEDYDEDTTDDRRRLLADHDRPKSPAESTLDHSAYELEASSNRV